MKQIVLTAVLVLWDFVVPVHALAGKAAGTGRNPFSDCSVSEIQELVPMPGVQTHSAEPGAPFRLSTDKQIFGLIATENRQPRPQRLYPAHQSINPSGYQWHPIIDPPARAALSIYWQLGTYQTKRFEGPDIIFPHFYSW